MGHGLMYEDSAVIPTIAKPTIVHKSIYNNIISSNAQLLLSSIFRLLFSHTDDLCIFV